MAERRMLSRQIIKNDVFLDLPLSAQALYMHICLEADDDGFVGGVNGILRSIGASKKDLDLLLDNRYLLDFPTNNCICVKHWKVHNYIQSDRYKKTTYQEEISMLEMDFKKGYKENDLYFEACKTLEMYPKCIHRIGKVIDRVNIELDKVNIYNNNIADASCNDISLKNDEENTKKHSFIPPTLEEITKTIAENNYSVDPQVFFDFYDSKGWMVGKNKMKNWKTALSGWNARSKQNAFRSSPKPEKQQAPVPDWFKEYKGESKQAESNQTTIDLDMEKAAKELFGDVK